MGHPLHPLHQHSMSGSAALLLLLSAALVASFTAQDRSVVEYDGDYGDYGSEYDSQYDYYEDEADRTLLSEFDYEEYFDEEYFDEEYLDSAAGSSFDYGMY